MTASSGEMQDRVHRFPIRVYIEDTDRAGIVYYANYLKYAERARTEFLRLAGHGHARMIDQWGVVFVVRKCEAEYLAPARLEDDIQVYTTIENVGGATVEMAQTVRRQDDDLVRMKFRLASVGLESGRPVRLPADMRVALGNLAGT